MGIKIKKSDIPIIFFCIGIFMFPYILRERIISSFAKINIIVYLGLFIAFNKRIFSIKHRRAGSIFYKVILIFFILVLGGLLFFVKGNGWSILGKINLLFIYVFPMIFLFLEVENENIISSYIDKWYKVLCIVTYFLIICWGLDILLGKIIQNLWLIIYDSTSLSGLASRNRFISFYGHSLSNAYYFLVFLCWTMVRKELNSHNKLYIFNICIGLLGIAICGSKSALIIAISTILVYHLGVKNIKYLVLIMVLLLSMYFFGVFDLVIDRLLEGIASGDITTSRNTALQRLIENGMVTFDWFKGNEINYSIEYNMVAALEYPMLRWAYTTGSFFSYIMVIVYFVYPIIRLIIEKNIKVLVCALAIILFVNCNNGISAYNDDLLFYSINVGFIFLILKAENLKENAT